jgi:hypothetical protein
MEFESPRFQGDAELFDILNDPDTGTRKLGPGSPPGSVRRLQQALFDLGWTLRIDPPFDDEANFVIGIYGPITTKTVLAYKTHYDIHFPPSAPTGFIDGFAGPRTFQILDHHCVLHDASAEAIEGKAAELREMGVDVQLDEIRPTTLPILGTHGCMRSAQIDGQIGGIWQERDIGAFEVHGPIAEKYVSMHHAGGQLGFPTSDVFQEDTDTSRSDFQHGIIRYHVSTDQTEVEPNA